MGWWEGVGKALELVGRAGRTSAAERSGDTALAPRGLLGGLEAHLANVLVSALNQAFQHDAARLDVEREQARAERERAEAALRLELARQQADRQLSQLRAVVALDALVWLASLGFVIAHPIGETLGRSLLALAWLALTLGLGLAFRAYGHLSRESVLEGHAPPHALEAASLLAVGGLGLAAACVIVSMA
jgi:hypothetical protein